MHVVGLVRYNFDRILLLQMMQDWLGEHKLDRKQLVGLASNAQAAQTYQDYLNQTVLQVVDDMLAQFDEPSPDQGTLHLHTTNMSCIMLQATFCTKSGLGRSREEPRARWVQVCTFGCTARVRSSQV